jgi:flap endonuclease-1
MGIKNLNSFLEKHAKMAITETNLSRYKNKKCAIDTSIFLYKFKYCGKFFESFINQVSHFKRFDINPIYVFDGAPPEEKVEVMENRKEQKNRTLAKIKELEELKETTEDEEGKQKLEIIIKQTKKKIINITKEDIINLKKVFDILGVKYIQANCEADLICCNLFKLKKVDLCLSNDMDFLPSGSGILLRNYNNSNNVLEYNLNYILQILNLSYEQFVDFCILCGCDYTCKIPKLGSETAYKLIKIHNNIETIIENVCGEGKKFKLPPKFEFQKARNLIMKNETLEDIRIENNDFIKPKVLNMKTCDFNLVKELTSFSKKQIENRFNKILC